MLTSKERLEILERISKKDYKKEEQLTKEEVKHSLRICLGIAQHECTECYYFKLKKLSKNGEFHCINKLYSDVIGSNYGSN